jgi:hypothetical protein
MLKDQKKSNTHKVLEKYLIKQSNIFPPQIFKKNKMFCHFHKKI